MTFFASLYLRRETAPHRVGRSLGAVDATGLGENVADMRGYGVEADRQHRRDVGVAAADRDQAQDLGLARGQVVGCAGAGQLAEAASGALLQCPDRKSTRLNSSHSQISYAV